MKKLLLILILLSVLFSCKSRKLSIQKSSTIDKTVINEKSTVSEKVIDSKKLEESQQKISTDKSGTWIWEEWYEKDKIDDTLIKPVSKNLLYKKTTFIQNDIIKSENLDKSFLENHSELKDSTGSKEAKNDIKADTKKKDLDAKKESSVVWIWALTGLVLVIGVLIFIIKK